MSKGLLYCGAMSFADFAGGITVLKYEDGKAEKLGVFGEDISSQSILAKTDKFMLAVSERRGGGDVVSYRICEDGSLDKVCVLPSDLGPLSYVSVTPEGDYAFVTCMGEGCLRMFRIGEDGSLTMTDDRRMNGHGLTKRQMFGKTHSSQISPDGKMLACANLGADELELFRIDKEAEKTVRVQSQWVDPGQMPRHMAFHPSGRFLYLVTETGCRMYAYSFDGEKLTEMAAYSLLDPALTDDAMASDVRISPDGRFICAAVRGQNQVAVFRILESGLLDCMGHFPTGGTETRGLGFSSDGGELFCANRNEGTITRLVFDKETGKLGEPEVIADAPCAGSVMFVS